MGEMTRKGIGVSRGCDKQKKGTSCQAPSHAGKCGGPLVKIQGEKRGNIIKNMPV